jgi:hypothetical protein
MRTRTWKTLGMTGALIGTMAGCGARQTNPPPPVAAVATTETATGVVDEEVVTVAAKVVAVDLENRVVTLRGPDGKVTDVTVGDEVRNLPQVRKGDDVVATYYESIAITVRKPGAAKPGIETADVAERAQLGAKPAAGAARQTTVTATIVGLDKKKSTATLKGPRGKVVTVNVRDPKRFDNVKVGDLVEVVYTEAVAISVEKPAKK